MIDRIEIKVKAGAGGSGVVSFRREMYVPFGGPDGGDGGKGGDVVIMADKSTDSLRAFRYKRLYRAEGGNNGRGRKKHGKDGSDLVLAVPAGTMVTAIGENRTNVMLGDLERVGEKIVVAEGGKGGWGNVHYKSSTNQAPRIAQRGEKGEGKTLKLEMRLIADVGVIGYPNAGKSTLLTRASAAKPRIADYPFTTLEPVLGVVEIGIESFVMAEIPGLIEGAHTGKGLGHDFLQHAMRTKVFIHLISGTSETPAEDMIKLNNELAMFDPALAQKPQIVTVNKIDLPEVQEKLESIKKELTAAGVKAHYISAATGEGVGGLMKETFNILKTKAEEQKPVVTPGKIFRPQPREARVQVRREGKEWVISAPGLDRLIAGSGVTSDELRWQLNQQLSKAGVNKALEKAGARVGDKVRCGDLAWEWDSPGRKRNRIGILGGTFDPVHRGHIMMAEEAKTVLDLSEVLLIPAGQPVLKGTENVTPAKHRMEMLKLAIEGRKYLKLSTIEIERKGPSYTVDTLEEIGKKSGGSDDLYFILGWDSLTHLPDWHEPLRLISMCTLVAVPRPGCAKPGLKALEGLLPGISEKVIFLERPRVDISSSEIREMAVKGESIDDLVPKAVAKYIKKNNLYQD